MEEVGPSSPKRTKCEDSRAPPCRCRRRYKYETPPADPALCCFEWLPDEIHEAILRNLHPVYATLPVRETCARWRRIMPSLLPPEKMAALPSRPPPRAVRYLSTNTYGGKLFMLYVHWGELNLLRYHFSNMKILGNFWNASAWTIHPLRVEPAFCSHYVSDHSPWLTEEDLGKEAFENDALGNAWTSVSWIIGPERPSPELLDWLHLSKRMPITMRCLKYIMRHRRHDLLEMDCVRSAAIQDGQTAARFALKRDCMGFWDWLWKNHLREHWTTRTCVEVEVGAVIRAALMHGRFQALFDILEVRPATHPVWNGNAARVAKGAIKTQQLASLDFLQGILMENGRRMMREDVEALENYTFRTLRGKSYRWLVEHYQEVMSPPTRKSIRDIVAAHRSERRSKIVRRFITVLFDAWPSLAGTLRLEEVSETNDAIRQLDSLRRALFDAHPSLLSLFYDRGAISINNAELVRLMESWGEKLPREFVDKVAKSPSTTNTAIWTKKKRK